MFFTEISKVLLDFEEHMLGFTALFVQHCLKLAKSCSLSVSSTSTQKILYFPKYLDFLCS